MKKYSFIGILFAGLIIFLSACYSLPFDSSRNDTWSAERMERPRGSIRVVSVIAEKSGEWGSLEREVRDLLPLLFSEEAYVVVPDYMAADYSAEVTVREREYPDGWQTRHSLSAEVRLWAGYDDIQKELLPLSAGRALVNGKQSIASSITLSSMLRKAVKGAILGLPSHNGNQDQGTGE